MAQLPKLVSGFPEWLPEARRIEQQWLDIARQVFESYGYASINPSSVEEVSVITAKGDDVDKEIYALHRLKGDDQQKKNARLALHFDLTVPTSRYVAQNYQHLTFPFKRYQIQRAWRGERPQEGRFREFTQADIDVIDNGEISLHFDAEMPKLVHKVLSRIGLDAICTHVNNRKILQGYYQGLAIQEPHKVISILDKLDKIGGERVLQLLQTELELSGTLAQKCLDLAQIKTFDSSFVEQVKALGVSHPLLEQGLTELKLVIDSASEIKTGQICADLSIARGLDYYTGTVFEGKLTEYPDFPTVYAGGRYDNLTGLFLNKKLPGVGISIGMTRIFSKMLKEGRLALAEKSPTDVLIINGQDNHLESLNHKAELLRERGINVEVYHDMNTKTAKQIRYADRKGIPYVLFDGEGGKDNKLVEIKSIQSGQQTAVNITEWQPSESGYQTRIMPANRCAIKPK